jgi:hypothetical protein
LLSNFSDGILGCHSSSDGGASASTPCATSTVRRRPGMATARGGRIRRRAPLRPARGGWIRSPLPCGRRGDVVEATPRSRPGVGPDAVKDRRLPPHRVLPLRRPRVPHRRGTPCPPSLPNFVGARNGRRNNDTMRNCRDETCNGVKADLFGFHPY